MQNVRDALTRAAALVDRGQFAAAEAIAMQIVRHLPDCAAALVLLGIVARKTGRPERAVEWLQKACTHRADDAAIRCELGRALADCRRLDEAAAEFRRAIDLNSADAGACLNLGAVLGQMDQPEAALPWCRRAVELAPNDAIAQFNRGNIARSLGLVDEAVESLETAVRFSPEFAAAHWDLAYCLLLTGNFARGWPEHEWRERAGEVAIDDYPQPRWQGESLAGRTILVHGEQGIGDEILFASCLPDVIERARRCLIVCEPRLEPLLRRSFPAAIVHGFSRRQDRKGLALAERIDFQIPIGSLPLHLRPTRESFVQREQFLAADPQQVAAWRQRFERLGRGLKIGVSWRAGGQPGERRMRTTSIEQWRPLLTLPNVQFINVQYGDCVDDLATARREFGVVIHDSPDADPLLDMDAFAAKIAAIDLIVSVDNSTVHLSGALGVPTWVLLPHVPGWRWTLSDLQSRWYPSARLFRQPARGDWPALFEHVGRILQKIAASPAQTAALVAAMNDDSAFEPARVQPGANRSRAIPEANTAAATPPDGATSTELGWTPTIDAAREAYRKGNFARAESLCRTVLNHSPRNVQAANLLGSLAAQSGRVDLAIRTLGRAAALAADDPVVLLNMAAALIDAGQFDRGIEAYRRVIEQHPALFDARLGSAKALHAAGRIEEAISILQQSLRSCPGQHKSCNLLGAWCLAAERPSEAEAAFREAIRLRPDYMAAHNNLGLALERQNRFAEAKACFTRACKLDPSCRQAANNLTSLENKFGQAARANLV